MGKHREAAVLVSSIVRRNAVFFGDDDAVVEPGRLRAELIARMVDADGWSRSVGRRYHPVSPV